MNKRMRAVGQQMQANLVIAITGLIAAICYGSLAWLSRFSIVDLGQFWLLITIAAASCFSLFFYLQRKDVDYPSSRLLLVHILFWAVVFRLIGIVGEPILEDDFYRYLWDGYRVVSDGNPYGVAPSQFFDSVLPSKIESVLEQINHPHLTTVYGPLCQWLFALSYWLAPAEVWPLKILLVLCDFLLIAMLLQIANIKFVLLYAWCPLVIKEVAFTAHIDVLAVLFLFAAYYFFRIRGQSKSVAVVYALPLFLALAVASKIFAALLVPFLLATRWREWLMFIAIVCICYLPFASPFFANSHLGNFSESGLVAMASGWLFNAPLYLLLQHFVPSFDQAYSILTMQFVMMALLFSLFLYYFWYLQKRQSLSQVRVDWLYGLFFLAIPFFNPWYCLWLLPFAVIMPSYWVWTASLMVMVSYGTGINSHHSPSFFSAFESGGELGAYELPNHLLIIEFGVIGVALLFDYVKFSVKNKANKKIG